MEKIKFYFTKYRQFIIYSFIGLSGATLDVLAYILLSETLSLNKVFSNTLSTSLGIINNFILNVIFNFKVKNNLLKRFLSFYSIGLVGLLLSNLIIYICVDILAFNNLLTKILTIFVVVLVQYNLNKKISFKQV